MQAEDGIRYLVRSRGLGDVYKRQAVHWKWLTPGQYQHVALMVTEIGRLLGGWQQDTIKRMAASAKPPPALPPAEEPYWANDA